MVNDPFWLLFAIFLVIIWTSLFIRAKRAARDAIPENFDLNDRPKVRFSGFRLVDHDIVWNSFALVFRVTSHSARYEVSATLSKRTSVERVQ